MFNLVTTLILTSLFLPAGFNFFTQRPVDFSLANSTNQIVTTPTRLINDSLGIKTTAGTVLVVDDRSQTVLYTKNSQVTASIASLTKLMTALVFLDNNPGWDKEITINPEDQREGNIVYLVNGERVTVKDLFNLMLVVSANEAAIALARSTGLDDFVAAMNIKAAQLGLTETKFVDPAGLNSANISSPSDLIKLANVAFSQPEIIQATSQEEYQFTVVNTKRFGLVRSTDQLLNSFVNNNPYQIVGAKTGFLEAAGYCFLVKVQHQDGQTITLVLLGANTQADRWQETKGLVDWIFSNYQW